jgi:hypothetical protein
MFGGQLVDNLVANLVDSTDHKQAKTQEQRKHKRLKGQHG